MSLYDYVYEALRDGKTWQEADDVPVLERAGLVEAWADTATKQEINEAYLAGEDDDDMRTLLDFAVGRQRDSAQAAMLRCFWAGMSWRVDDAIESARMELKAQPHEPMRLDEFVNWMEGVK